MNGNGVCVQSYVIEHHVHMTSKSRNKGAKHRKRTVQIFRNAIIVKLNNTTNAILSYSETNEQTLRYTP